MSAGWEVGQVFGKGVAMAGYFIYSLDAEAFQQLTTSPTIEQSLFLAKPILSDLEDMLEEYDGEEAADPAKWPWIVAP